MRIAEIAFGKDSAFLKKDDRFMQLSQPRNCAKMKVLHKLFDLWQKDGSKVLLFSMSLRLLDLLQTSIEARVCTYCLPPCFPARGAAFLTL